MSATVRLDALDGRVGTEIDLDVSKSNWNGSADYSFYGPNIFLTVNF